MCGAERILVEEVVDTIRARLRPDPVDYTSLTAGAAPDRDVWAAAHQYPLRPGAVRLTLVRSAERIRRWQPFDTWMASLRRMPGSHLLFVGDEPDPPKGAHIETIKTRGHLVRCATPNEADAVAWLRARAPLDEATARHLLARTAGDLWRAAGVCSKINLFGSPAGPAVIDKLVDQAPSACFVEALLADDKPTALRAAADLARDSYGETITTLDFRVDLLAQLSVAVRSGRRPRDVTDVPAYLVRQYWPIAGRYDARRCARARRMLAIVDNAYRAGARDALVEALVALW